jgi:hypothetical protein
MDYDGSLVSYYGPVVELSVAYGLSLDLQDTPVSLINETVKSDITV